LNFPFRPGINHALQSAKDHTVAWLNSFGMLQSQKAIDHFPALDMAKFAAYGAP